MWIEIDKESSNSIFKTAAILLTARGVKIVMAPILKQLYEIHLNGTT